MGSGRWTAERFELYAKERYGMGAGELEKADLKTQEVFRQRGISSLLDPRNVLRKCHDSAEHPETLPVILALDVTGSMGKAAVKTATCLNSIMSEIISSGEVKDVEFCVMALGDIHYDRAPIQISQFESDIRIAEQMDAVYFEGGGGGNNYESYSAAWYMGMRHCELHCWNRGKKGLIITMGDEMPNPYLNAKELNRVTGDRLQADVSTAELLREAQEKYEVYHLSVDDPQSTYQVNQRRYDLDGAWTKLLGKDRYRVVTVNGLNGVISSIVSDFADRQRSVTRPADGAAGKWHLW